jgi:hypothetical protein
MRQKSLRILSHMVVVMLCIIGSSCNKDTKCQGDVYVVRQSAPGAGNPVVNSKVVVSYASKTFTGFTDVTGRFHVELDLPAILDVTATVPTGYPGVTNPAPMSASAMGTLKFEAGKTNSVTLSL